MLQIFRQNLYRQVEITKKFFITFAFASLLSCDDYNQNLRKTAFEGICLREVQSIDRKTGTVSV